ncbi:MAG: hypothetical protein ACK2TZ_04915 [Anaerolineales bacterium]
MFTTNLFAIKIQQEETQRRAAHYRLVKSLATPRDFSDRWNKWVAGLAGKFKSESYTLSQAAR